ncbi:MAG: winged helix-turn-helix domain-containing protein [Terracidiphilus sp.]|jgi:DNA-binding winged helix-turn-helix (wHTH) protein/tetratricopeptide (TPR) repeat protein
MRQNSSTSPEEAEPGYTFGNLRLEADGTLLRGDAAIHLPPKELAALRLLLAHAGQIVTPLQLKKTLWGDVHVTAESVPRCMSSLRARLAPDDCVQTVYKRGYRFSAPTRRLDGPSRETLPRLAVMPFATGFNVPEHLGPAIAEEVVARLTSGRIAPVSVLARDSVFTLAGQELTALEVGRKLNADLVLAGRLRALPAHFRLRVELIRVDDGAQIWVEDLLVAQTRADELESELVQRLLSRLGSGGLSIAASAASASEDENDPVRREAYGIFQRARYEWQTLERHRMQDGLQHLSRAVALDPSLIAAKVDLVRLCVTQAFYGYMAPTAAADLLRRTAASIPDRHHQAEAILPALGWIDFHVHYDLPAALRAFSLSAHLPHDAWITRERVMFALSRHRWDEAVALQSDALDVDPYAPWLHARLAWTFHLAGQAAAGLEQVRHSLALFPGHDGVALYGAMILAYNGDAEAGVQLADDVARRQPYIDLLKGVHAYALACAGRKDEARAIIERLQWLSRERYVLRTFTAAVCVALGDLEGALRELRAAEEARCPWFLQMLADPRLKALHGQAEFVRMRKTLARMEASTATAQEHQG